MAAADVERLSEWVVAGFSEGEAKGERAEKLPSEPRVRLGPLPAPEAAAATEGGASAILDCSRCRFTKWQRPASGTDVAYAPHGPDGRLDLAAAAGVLETLLARPAGATTTSVLLTSVSGVNAPAAVAVAFLMHARKFDLLAAVLEVRSVGSLAAVDLAADLARLAYQTGRVGDEKRWRDLFEPIPPRCLVLTENWKVFEEADFEELPEDLRDEEENRVTAPYFATAPLIEV